MSSDFNIKIEGANECTRTFHMERLGTLIEKVVRVAEDKLLTRFMVIRDYTNNTKECKHDFTMAFGDKNDPNYIDVNLSALPGDAFIYCTKCHRSFDFSN